MGSAERGESHETVTWIRLSWCFRRSPDGHVGGLERGYCDARRLAGLEKNPIAASCHAPVTPPVASSQLVKF
jgi:hypothetical protein